MYLTFSTCIKIVRPPRFMCFWAKREIHVDRFKREALLFKNALKTRAVSVLPKTTSALSGAGGLRCQIETILKEVKMKEMSNGPTQIFWYNLGSLVPIAFPTLSFILTGFHPSLYALQIAYSPLLLALQGGVRLGYELENKALDWENVFLSLGPLMVGLVSMAMPSLLSPLILSAGFLMSAFVDLALTRFPAWYKAMRLAFVIPALVSLLLSFLWKLFH